MGIRLPDAQLLLYPVTDLKSLDSDSYAELEGMRVGLTRAQMKWFRERYLGNDADNLAEYGYVSPLRAKSLDGLPPALAAGRYRSTR